MKTKIVPVPVPETVSSTINVIKTFKYVKGAASLTFDLNLGKRSENIAFLELLEKAVEDVRTTIDAPIQSIKE